MIIDELDHYKKKFAKNYTEFLVKKVRSGSGTVILDPDPLLTKQKSVALHSYTSADPSISFLLS